MKITLCQLDSAWEDRSESARRVDLLASQAAPESDLLVFPEMTLTGFSMDSAATTLGPADHRVFTRLSEATGAAVIYGGVEGGQNRLFLADGSRHSALYAKRHLFTHGGERDAYQAGEGSPIAEIRGVRFGLAICYDLRFPYHFWANAGNVDAYLVIANWPASRRDHWLSLLKARAIENLAWVVGVNRVGDDPRLAYSGDSRAFGPLGEALLECGPEAGAFSFLLEPDRSARARSQFRFLEDRRP